MFPIRRRSVRRSFRRETQPDRKTDPPASDARVTVLRHRNARSETNRFGDRCGFDLSIIPRSLPFSPEPNRQKEKERETDRQREK
ncbi:hypothetical protein TIFTF001_010936 [Ficus carica]|uniref:Uncharacterized protein n=1 Tax=Ficus carica TaxID=3494 RepID=A0AA88AKN1_FICCA|nr:hypothetical protein TIFTF001_010936 [Ficus carica]